MKKRRNLFLANILILIFIITSIILINISNKVNIKILANAKVVKRQSSLINIAECSEGFIEEYFEKSNKWVVSGR